MDIDWKRLPDFVGGGVLAYGASKLINKVSKSLLKPKVAKFTASKPIQATKGIMYLEAADEVLDVLHKAPIYNKFEKLMGSFQATGNRILFPNSSVIGRLINDTSKKITANVLPIGTSIAKKIGLEGLADTVKNTQEGFEAKQGKAFSNSKLDSVMQGIKYGVLGSAPLLINRIAKKRIF